MSNPIIPRARVCEVFETFRSLHPTRSRGELCEMTAKATGLDLETVTQVVDSDLVETEGGSHD